MNLQLNKLILRTKCCNSGRFEIRENSVICMNSHCENYLFFTRVTNPSRNYLISTCVFFSGLLMVSAAPDQLMPGTVQRDVVLKSERSKRDSFVKFYPINLSNLRQELIRKEIICRSTVEAQAVLESGNFKSSLFRKTNNLFGMRYPAKRKTSAVGLYLTLEKKYIMGTQKEVKKYAALPNYAVYESWQKSVEDYKLWQDFSFRVNEKYLHFLDRIYAEDTLYIEKVRRIAGSKR